MRNSTNALIVLCCAGLLLAACGKKAPEEKQKDTSPPDRPEFAQQETIQDWDETKIYRGFAIFGQEKRLFQPCGSSTALWVTDHSGQFWDLHYDIVPHSEPLAQVFAIVEASQEPPPAEGPGRDYPGTLLIEEILYMTHEGLGCKTYWNSFHFRASGNEPSWSIEATDRKLHLTRIGESDQTWTSITVSRFENGVRYHGSDAGNAVELIITKIPCRDTMSGTYYGYNATLKLRSDTLRGCAVPGIDSFPPQPE